MAVYGGKAYGHEPYGGRVQDTRPRVRLFAPIKLKTVETVSLGAAIELDTRQVRLSAPIKLLTTEGVSLSAAIELETVDHALANRQAGLWDLKAEIGGQDYSAQLTGRAEIEEEVDASVVVSLNLYPAAGALDPAALVGKPVKLVWQDLDGSGGLNFRRTLFVGKLSDPTWEPAAGTLTVQCTSDLQGEIDTMDRAGIDALIAGQWSPHVFSEGAQGWDYAQDRKRTRPVELWHTPAGIRVVDIAAKAAPDFTFTDADIDDGSASYEPGTRRDLLNTVVIGFDFRYQRQRQRTLGVRFPPGTSFCHRLQQPYTLCQRSMVESAAAGANGWELQGAVQFEDLPPAGLYRCDFHWYGWGRLLGDLVIEPESHKALCWGASWSVAARWSQTVTERYQIRVTAPNSIEALGTIGRQESYALEADATETETWLAAGDYSTGLTGHVAQSGGVSLGGGKVLGDTVKDDVGAPDSGRQAADQAQRTMIGMATADILRAHRSARVRFTTVYQPALNLSHTVRLQTSNLVAKGKVFALRHGFDFDTGEVTTEVTLALSRHEGTGLVSPTPLDPAPAPAQPDEIGIPTRLHVPTRIGGRKTSPPYQEGWDGHITNYEFGGAGADSDTTDPAHPGSRIYPHQFVVEYPEISQAHLEALELQAEHGVLVDVPQDELTLTQ